MKSAQVILDFSLIDCEKTYGNWIITNKGDKACRFLADRHYSRRTVGAAQFTRPGTNLVLRTANGLATFVAWRSKFKRKDKYGNAWECSIFRNETGSGYLSSDLIKYALYATVEEWGNLPEDGFITYVDPLSVKSDNPGYCFEKAGFVRQPYRSTRGYIAFKTDQDSLNLVLREMSLVHYLEFCKYNISIALNSGEFMDAYEFQEDAAETESKLESLKKHMKEKNLKAWSSFESSVTKEDLDLITDPISNWMADRDYFLQCGIRLGLE
jgi:hypothetical protein